MIFQLNYNMWNRSSWQDTTTGFDLNHKMKRVEWIAKGLEFKIRLLRWMTTPKSLTCSTNFWTNQGATNSWQLWRKFYIPYKAFWSTKEIQELIVTIYSRDKQFFTVTTLTWLSDSLNSCEIKCRGLKHVDTLLLWRIHVSAPTPKWLSENTWLNMIFCRNWTNSSLIMKGTPEKELSSWLCYQGFNV